jgi:hypothetical protein
MNSISIHKKHYDSLYLNIQGIDIPYLEKMNTVS